MNNWKFIGPNFLWFFSVLLFCCGVELILWFCLKTVWVYFFSSLLKCLTFWSEIAEMIFPLWNRKTWITFSRCAFNYYCRSLRLVLLRTFSSYLFFWLVLVMVMVIFVEFLIIKCFFPCNFILFYRCNRTLYIFHNLQITKQNLSFFFMSIILSNRVNKMFVLWKCFPLSAVCPYNIYVFFFTVYLFRTNFDVWKK